MIRDDMIMRDAIVWFDRINRAVFDSADGAEFDRWMDRDPRHREAFAKAAALWDGEVLAQVLVDECRLPQAKPPHVPLGLSWHRTSAAMGALAILLVAILALPSMLPRSYASSSGQMETVVLADGSRMTLGGNTFVQVHYLPWRRTVTLTRGEVFFDVAHDRDRPFDVASGTANISVLGTAFHVDRLGSGRVAVQVSRGSVNVTDNRAALRLRAGEAAQLAGGQIRRVTMQQENSDWRSGWFVARDVPLADVVEKLRRHSDIRIEFSDQQIGEQKIVGRFKVDEPKIALLALQQSYELTVTYDKDEIMISKQK